MGLRQKGKGRAPKRSQTHADYQIPSAPAPSWGSSTTTYNLPSRPHPSHSNSQSGFSVPETIPEASVLQSKPQPGNESQVPRPRPPLPTPRRSYSATDKEPEPQFPLASTRLALEDLPGELHYTLFDFLDPIDATCLGLTNKHFYDIHRRMHGPVPLSARREGPNELEWTWHLASRHVDANGRPSPPSTPRAEDDAGGNSLAMLRVRGQGLCRKCGISRCQLHVHIREWMGEAYEYCEVRQRFGPPAPEGAKAVCSMRNPQNPNRCGRHRDRRSKPAACGEMS